MLNIPFIFVTAITVLSRVMDHVITNIQDDNFTNNNLILFTNQVLKTLIILKLV